MATKESSPMPAAAEESVEEEYGSAPVKRWRTKVTSDLKDQLQRLRVELYKLGEEMADDVGENREAFYPPHCGWYWGFVGAYVCMQMALMYFVSLPLMAKVVQIGTSINIGITLLLLQTTHFLGSFCSIEVNDLAGFTLFGRPLFAPKNGPYIAPLGFIKIIRANRNYRDERFPGPADKIFRVSTASQKEREGGDMPPKGRFRPILVTTGESHLIAAKKTEKLPSLDVRNPLDRQLVIEISYFVRYRPSKQNGGIFRIARNLTAVTEKIDERIKDLIREQSERDMKVILSHLTPATIIENQELVNEVFVAMLRVKTIRLGIDIDGGGISELNLSHDTNEKQARVARAEFERMETIVKAEGEKIQLMQQGAGRGAAEQAELAGRAIGSKELRDSIGVTGESIIAAEAVRQILTKTDVILAGGEGGMKDIMALVKGAQSVLSPRLKTKDAAKPAAKTTNEKTAMKPAAKAADEKGV